MSESIDRLRLVGVPGTGKVMAGELSRLVRRGFSDKRLDRPVKEGAGAVAFPFDPQVALLAARYHRTASRVLWDLYRSRASQLDPLYKEIKAQVAADERPWVRGKTFSIRARNIQEFAAGERQVVGTIKNAIIDGAAERGVALSIEADKPDFLVSLSMHDDAVTVALDLVGRAMHKRGYRRKGGGQAPLRENLAAALVMLARFDSRKEFLVDPTAGSGTICIEAALMARATPLFQKPIFADELLADGAVPSEPLFADTNPVIYANELDAAQSELCRGNCERAGVAADVVVVTGDFRDLDLDRLRGEYDFGDKTPLVLANLPYGIRLPQDELAETYEDMDRWLNAFPGGRAALYVANPEYELATSRRAKSRKPLRNGSLSATLYQYLL